MYATRAVTANDAVTRVVTCFRPARYIRRDPTFQGDRVGARVDDVRRVRKTVYTDRHARIMASRWDV